MEAQFKDLTFKSDREWKQWLKENTYKKIQFKDNEQDLMEIHVAENGEIIECNLQSSIWNGMFVNLNKLDSNRAIQFWTSLNGGKWRTQSFIIDKVQTFLKK